MRSVPCQLRRRIAPATMLLFPAVLLAWQGIATGEGGLDQDTARRVRRFGPADPARIIPAVDDSGSHLVALASHRRAYYGPPGRFYYYSRPWYARGYHARYYAYRPWYRLYSPGWYVAIPRAPFSYSYSYWSDYPAGLGIVRYWGYPPGYATPVFPGYGAAWYGGAYVDDCYYW